MKPPTPADWKAFWGRIVHGPADACWRHTFVVSNNLPMVREAGRDVSARRWWWERCKGQLKKSDRIIVRCEVWCMNPEHFQKVSGDPSRTRNKVKMRDLGRARAETKQALGQKLGWILDL